MSRRPRWATDVLLFAIAGSLTFALWNAQLPGLTVSQLDQLIRESAPLGTRQSKVHEWLTSQGFRLSDFEISDPINVDTFGGKTILQMAELDKAPPAAYSRASVTVRTLFGPPTEFNMYFFFEGNKQLVKHYVYSREISL